MSSNPDTGRRILDAALAEATAGELTMAGVAARAGLSRQAVYLHFPDRAALLAALAKRLAPDMPSLMEAIAQALSARAALAVMLEWQRGHYPRLARIAGGASAADMLAPCRALAERFRAEGRLAPHLSPEAAADLLWSLTGPGVWDSLVTGRGWSAARARDNLIFLSVSAVTK